MKSSLLVILYLLMIVIIPSSAFSQQADVKKNVQIMENDDGSFSELSRSSDNRTIERKTYAKQKGGKGQKKLIMSIIYRKDPQGRLRSGTLHSASGKILYRIRYGYNKHNGLLAQEEMFDAAVKRTKIVTGPDGKPKEIEEAVRIVYHRYDVNQNPLQIFSVTLPAGERAEELFGKNKGSYIKDPWADK